MFKKWSFKTKLQVAIGLLSFLSLGVVGRLTYTLNHDLTQNKIQLLERSAEAIADKVDRNLFERYGDVQAFAMSEPARSGDPARITNFLRDMMGAYAPVYDVMMVLDRKGSVIAINAVDKNGKPLDPKKMLGKNYADQDWFKAAVEGKIPVGTAHYSDLRIDSDTASYASTDGKVMIFTSPIRDESTGEILGVWSNRMSWKDVVEDIVFKESVKLQDERMPVVAAYLLSADRTYLVNKDPSQVLKGKSDSVESFLSSNKDTGSLIRDDNDQIKANAIEAFAKAKGYMTYPSQPWVYSLRVQATDSHVTFAVFSSLFGLCMILAMAVLSIVVAARTANTLENIIERLRTGSSGVSKTASDVTNAAYSLSEASTQQASALQETAASIEEINAMIKKSSDNSRRSQDLSEQASEIAKRGKDSVEKMSLAINEINVSNEAILTQIGESNSQISEIARVIAEIGNKTKVINDIVFQTKLLSFNASVEAARAGEHGKGFAVVAEEVGNLAQMSGNAAKEISEMLAESIKSVEGIVENTKQKVERLISDGRQKVQSGIVIADQCGTVLNEVVDNVAELNTMVTEISVASQEQSQGVNEITKAMNELDQTTHANATTSQHVSGYATSLSEESKDMNGIVVELLAVVQGVDDAADREPNSAKAGAGNHNVVQLKSKHKENNQAPAVKLLKKASGDSMPNSEDPRFKDV